MGTNRIRKTTQRNDASKKIDRGLTEIASLNTICAAVAAAKNVANPSGGHGRPWTAVGWPTAKFFRVWVTDEYIAPESGAGRKNDDGEHACPSLGYGPGS